MSTLFRGGPVLGEDDRDWESPQVCVGVEDPNLSLDDDRELPVAYYRQAGPGVYDFVRVTLDGREWSDDEVEALIARRERAGYWPRMWD